MRLLTLGLALSLLAPAAAYPPPPKTGAATGPAVTLQAAVTCPGLTELGPWNSVPNLPPPEFHPRTGRLTWTTELPAGESSWSWTWG